MARVIVWITVLGLVACGPDAMGTADDTGGEAGGGKGDGIGPDAGAGEMLADADDDHVADANDNCPANANKDQEDGDADGYGDACDCDPVDPERKGDLVLMDSLATNKNLFSTAPGFPAASWSYANNALRQTRLIDNSDDATFLASAVASMNNVMVEVTIASTEMADFGTTDRRQIFLLAGASSATDKFAAIACGPEVIEPISPAERTSTITLGGTPAAVTTVPIVRTPRAQFQVNEEVHIRMDLQKDAMTCTVTIATTKTTATATGLPTLDGKLGLYTRETKAMFKNLRVCSYR